jgi:hypothetical protein
MIPMTNLRKFDKKIQNSWSMRMSNLTRRKFDHLFHQSKYCLIINKKLGMIQKH